MKIRKRINVCNRNQLVLFVVLRQNKSATSTTIFKAMIAIKTGNPIIFAFHPSAQESSKRAAEVVLEAAELRQVHLKILFSGLKCLLSSNKTINESQRYCISLEQQAVRVWLSLHIQRQTGIRCGTR